jgi:hypothetical protein
VRGFQAVYREGLAALEAAAGVGSFADLPGPARDVILRTSRDDAIADLIDIAFPHTLEFMYGAPEYGGNRDLAGWKYTNYDGDVQPRGWTREQIEEPDATGTPELVPDLPLAVPLEDLLALAPLASPDAAFHVVDRSGGTLSGLRAAVDTILDAARRERRRGR